jgi:phospholipase C
MRVTPTPVGLTLGSLVLVAAGAALVAHAARSASIPESTVVRDLRAHVKYVFVIYEENESFDHYFGSYPGAENLTSPLAQLHGFHQWDPMAKTWITPFRITDPDVSSPGHPRALMIEKIDGGKMDRYVAAQEKASLKEYDSANARRVALGEMSFYDCDTIPFVWKYAHAFALFDRYFEGMAGPSTPGNIEAIAGQSGETQWARFPNERTDGKKPGDPILNDLDPPFGPYPGPADKKLQIDQRYATVMLTLAGRAGSGATNDTKGVREDLASVATRPSIPWGWYQEGYTGSGATAMAGYEAHHNAVQYFGYMRENGVFWNNVHPIALILKQLTSGTLPRRGAFYIKGASVNHFGWRPANKDPFVRAHFLGDDDHPGTDDSDRQIAERFIATFVNAIAKSKYWKNSAIVITWDDDGGYWDHVPPPQFERCFDGHPCGDGGRIPLIVISPYARSGAIVPETDDTSSIPRFIEAVFGLPALASLPDERPYMPYGPRDANPRLGNLVAGFDPLRLSGVRAPIPASAAEIPESVLSSTPLRMSCTTLGITPVSIPGANTPPAGYAPRSSQYVP